MNATTKAQHLIKSLNKASAEVSEAVKIMGDADISTAMWTEIKDIDVLLFAVLEVLEENENAK